EGDLALCRREGKPSISAESTDPVRLDRTNRQAQSQTELGEGRGKKQEAIVNKVRALPADIPPQQVRFELTLHRETGQLPIHRPRELLGFQSSRLFRSSWGSSWK